MSSAVPCEIEAIFGSSARGDADVYSDIDVLLVDDDGTRLKTRKAWLAANGFSVSDYSWRRLFNLFEKRALFATHLKLESKVLHDARGRYRDLLSSSQTATDYTALFDQSLLLFSSIETIPNSQVGRMWAIDHFTVAFRNSAILLLATKGKFVFSFSSLFNELMQAGKHTTTEVASLHKIRGIKRAYRSGLRSAVTKADVVGVARAVDSAFSLGLHSTFVSGLRYSP
jgi:hypothetical protein